MKQILVNLLSNGVKFTAKEGAVRIATSVTEHGEICFEIRDRGIGMSEEDLEVAKSRFGRIESSAQSKYPGTGLGLPLASDLTRLHGGQLDIESQVGEGTTVVVLFPPERTVYEASEAGRAQR